MGPRRSERVPASPTSAHYRFFRAERLTRMHDLMAHVANWVAICGLGEHMCAKEKQGMSARIAGREAPPGLLTHIFANLQHY